ncbi:MAG: hypothetical protein ABIG39_04670 [Candidatus Micrarchaeota archaeon]
MGNRCSRGALFSIDTLFATLAVVLITYVAIISYALIAQRTFQMVDSNEMDAKLLLLSDYLVKSKLVYSDNARAYQHKLQLQKLESLELEELASEFGLGRVGVRLIVDGERVFERGSGDNCLRRVAWVPEYGKVGFLETCIE